MADSQRAAPAAPESTSASLRAALSAELRALENAVAVGGMVSVSAAAVMPLVIWAMGDPAQARAVALGGVVMCSWFGGSWLYLRRRQAGALYSLVATLAEAALPPLLIVLEMLYADPDIGLSRTALVMAFAYPLILAVLRLRPALPLISGISAALFYALAIFLVGYPRASPQALAMLPPPAVIERCILIVVGGAIGALASRALWRAITLAYQKVRSRDLFGKYRLGARIAAGGMGEVWRATYCPEGGFARAVAIKRIHPHLAECEDFIDSFRAEAALCSHLGHPNIVQVLDFGSIENTYFYAMEFVDGLALGDLLRRATRAGMPLPPRLVAFIGREICAGLHFAHELARGPAGEALHVVHRDISPPNVLLSRTGQVKITDFGVAKVLRGAAQTQTSTVAGKLAYMAPEQASGEALDRRCDLFAVGILVWEMLCLRYLFPRTNDAVTLHAVLTGELPAPSSVRAGLRPEWDAFCARALQRKADARFQSAVEMTAALDALLELEGVPKPDELSRWLGELEQMSPPSGAVPTINTFLPPQQAVESDPSEKETIPARRLP